jgi:hypothetical protein
MGFFLLLYIGIAFVTDETLIALMEFTRRSLILTALLALLPLNCAARMVQETLIHLGRRRALAGKAAEPPDGAFDDAVRLEAAPAFADLARRLESAGYRTRSSEGTLAAWRGVNLFPIRMLYLAAVFCLFAGILISLSSRDSQRGAIIEGERLTSPSGKGGRVERIVLANSSGPILAKTLDIEVAAAEPGGEKSVFGLYPPALYGGEFVYPRYLGVGLHLRFTAPDLPAGFETHSILNIHPPGKEDTVEIPESPYRIVASLLPSEDGSDPYVTGRMAFRFKVLKEKQVVLEGSAPSGGEAAGNGYRLSFPDSRRLVITDFIRDYGVLLIWAASLMFLVAGCIWLPVRLLLPRREMLFACAAGAIASFSRAEGQRRKHEGVFNEALDSLETKRHQESLDGVAPE